MKSKNYFLCAILMLATMFTLYAQDTSLPVGAIPGTIDVSPMGATTYTIPIEVVPGTQGMQPNLSIVYNNLSGMGLLGMKWNLAGLSAITRRGKIPYFDMGELTTIRFDNNDKYAIDGEMLIYDASTYQYAKEVEDFTRIVRTGDNPFPDHFTAYTDDGRVIEYGNSFYSKQYVGTVGSNKILSWHINKITDADGNYMTFSYSWDNGETYLTAINYTGNSETGSPTYAVVSFEYANNIPQNLSKNTSFVYGYGIPQTKFLKSISISCNNERVRKYKFNYMHENSTDTQRTIHLNEVILYGETDNEQLNATTISWESQSNSLQNDAATLQGIPDGYILTGDYNGDGFTDYVIYGASNLMVWKLYHNIPNTTTYSLVDSGRHNTINNNGDNVFFLKADVNGDGCDELIYACAYNYDVGHFDFTVISLKDGQSIMNTATIEYFDKIFFGDFDGDGKTDILFVKKDLNNKVLFQFYFDNGFYDNLGLPENTTIKKVRVGDFSGNGKTDIELVYDDDKADIYVLNNSNFSKLSLNLTANHIYERYSGDFNGDGISDLLTYEKNGLYAITWKVSFGKGDGNYTNATTLTGLDIQLESVDGSIVPQYKIMIADLDGDGKDDIIQVLGSKVNILYSKGCTTEGVNNYKYQYKSVTQSLSGYPSQPKHFNIADMNHDGILDLIIQSSRIYKPNIAYLHKGKKYDCPTSIVDGMGKIIQLSFTPKYWIAESETPVKKYFFHLLSNLKISNGIYEGLNTIQYTYDKPAFSWLRRSFMGFGKFTSLNIIENKKDSLSFVFDDSKFILKPKSHHTYMNETCISESIYDITCLDFSNNRYVPYNNETTVKEVLSDTRTVSSTTLYPNGKVKTTNTTINNISNNNYQYGTIHTYTYETITIDGSQKKTVPVKILIEQHYGGTIYTAYTTFDTTTYAYYSGAEKGRLHWVRQGNSNRSITTTFQDYTPAGVCGKKTISAQGCEPRTEYFEYDTTQRFVTKNTNPLGHETLFSYDPKTGNKLTETDPNGLTTNYTYDGLGNLTQIDYPNGEKEEYTIRWYYYNSSIIKYYIENKTTGKSYLATYYDILGREVRKEEGMNNIYSETNYNEKGQVEFYWNKTQYLFLYDDFGRISKEEALLYKDVSYSYDKRKVTITDNLRGTVSSKDYDALGRIISAEDPGGTLTYSYSFSYLSSSRHRTTILNSASGTTTTIETDAWGNRTSILDPNAGEINSFYNNFNELIEQYDARGNFTTYQYDALGRVTKKILSRYKNSDTLTITYTYDNFSTLHKGIGKLYQIHLNGVLNESFLYNNKGSLWQHLKNIDGVDFSMNYYYNTEGLLYYLYYPEGYVVGYNYDPLYNINGIFDDNNTPKLIYRVNKRNRYWQPLKCEYGNKMKTDYTYNTYGLLTEIITYPIALMAWNVHSDDGGTVIDTAAVFGGFENERGSSNNNSILNYIYNYNNKGLMISREDKAVNQTETYEYDNLDRLTLNKFKVENKFSISQTFTYANNGNITKNSTVGTYTYSPFLPNAVSSVKISTGAIQTTKNEVEYNFFNQPSLIKESDYQLELSYGADQQRNKMVTKKNDTIISTRYYINKYYEMEIDSITGVTRHYNYVYGDEGVVALNIATYNPSKRIDSLIIIHHGDTVVPLIEGIDTLYYIHTDHAGSYCAITNGSRQVVQRNSFDPWGNYAFERHGLSNIITPPQRGDTLSGLSFPITTRGFTGHEHYPTMRIINMNGRLYDPVIARFFSPDNFVQLPEFTQSFNRYSYCLNNPLAYTDPSGERWIDFDDIWEFDIDGHFLNRIENKEYDQIRIINSDGTTYAESKKFDYGFLENKMIFHKREDAKIAGIKELQSLEGLSMFFGENLRGAMAFFRFMAANTTPEWTAFGRNNFHGGIENILDTTHKPDFEFFGSQMAENSAPNGNLFHIFHSQKTSQYPSNRISNGHGSDMEYRLRIVDNSDPDKPQSPNAIFGILYDGKIHGYFKQEKIPGY